LCRFDEFIPGIAVAMLKNFHRPAWERLMAHGGALSALGAGAVATMLTLAHFFYDIRGYGWGFFMTTFGYSLVALSFSLLVAAALSPAARVLQWRIPGAGRMALWSYAIYLSHKSLAVWLGHQLAPLDMPDAAQLAIITLACVAMGGLLHKLVEAPFMALRDRLVPSNFADDARPASSASVAAAVEAVSP
jgi:peptidoglycan/LPS O-acetylase OafA/YrhL